MPFAEEPTDETEGVEPGKPKVAGEECAGEEPNRPVVVLKENCARWPPTPAMYRELLQKALVANIAFPRLRLWTTLLGPVGPL